MRALPILALLGGCGFYEPIPSYWASFSLADAPLDALEDGERVLFVYADGTVVGSRLIYALDGTTTDVEGANVNNVGHFVRGSGGTGILEMSSDRGATWDDITPSGLPDTWGWQIDTDGGVTIIADDDGTQRIWHSNPDGRGWKHTSVSKKGVGSLLDVVDGGLVFTDDSGASDPTLWYAGSFSGSPRKLVAPEGYRSAPPEGVSAGGVPWYNSYHSYWAGSGGSGFWEEEALPITFAPHWTPHVPAREMFALRSTSLRQQATTLLGIDEEDHVWMLDGDGDAWRTDQPLGLNRKVRDDQLVGPRCELRIWPAEFSTTGGDLGQLVVLNESDEPIVVRRGFDERDFDFSEPIEPGGAESFLGQEGMVVLIENTDGACWGFYKLEGAFSQLTVTQP